MNTTDLVSIADIQISFLKEEQIEKLLPIYKNSFQGMTEDNLIYQWFRANIKAYPRMMCFGAWHKESLIGYALWNEKGGLRSNAIIELEQIAILSRYRNQGIGTKLIQSSLKLVEDKVKERNATIKLIEITTGINNPANIFYEKALGAKQECVIKDYYSGDEQIMRARSSPVDSLTTEEKALLKLEYEVCQDGYNNRDRLIPQELSYIIALFGGLMAVIALAFNIFSKGDELELRAVIIGIGLCGFVGLLGLVIDLESNSSCKKAIRKRSKEIEELLSPMQKQQLNVTPILSKRQKLLRLINNMNMSLMKRKQQSHKSEQVSDMPPLCLWRIGIENRKRHKLEHLVKIRETGYFVIAGRFLLILWIIVIVVLAVYAPSHLSTPETTSLAMISPILF